MRLKICFKKGGPPRRKQHPIPLPGGSQRQAHYQELFEHTQLFGHKLKQIVEFLSGNLAWAEIGFKIEKLFDFPKMSENLDWAEH